MSLQWFIAEERFNILTFIPKAIIRNVTFAFTFEDQTPNRLTSGYLANLKLFVPRDLKYSLLLQKMVMWGAQIQSVTHLMMVSISLNED